MSAMPFRTVKWNVLQMCVILSKEGLPHLQTDRDTDTQKAFNTVTFRVGRGCMAYWMVLDCMIGFVGIPLWTIGKYSAIAFPIIYRSLLHALVSSVYYTLHYSFPGNGFITVSLLLQITHQVFFALPEFELSTELFRFLQHMPTANSRTLNIILYCLCQPRNSTQL
jgi:uncharacterized membrane protein YhdT